jgi:hypothetical protein
MLARLLGMRVLFRFLWPGLRRRMFLAFLRRGALHLWGWTLLRGRTLLNRMLHLRNRMLHLRNRTLHLGSGMLYLGSRVCFLPGWRRVRLGGRPCLLDRSRMRLHRLDRALWLVWLYLLLGDGPGDLPYGRNCLRLQVLHSKRPSHGHRLRPSVVH